MMTFDGVNGTIKYEGDTITGFSGRIEKIEVPADLNIKRIDKKAFFGAKNLSEVVLSQTINEIGQWAFASCSALTTFTALGRPAFSQGVFNNAEALKKINIQNGESYSELLPLCATSLSADYLLTDTGIGSDEWIIKLDNRIRDFLNEDDSIGYEQHVLCGEEDLLFDINVYLRRNRLKKANIAYIRLINNDRLDADMEGFLSDYLSERTLLCENEAGFEALLLNASDDRFIDTFLNLGMCNDDNFEQALLRIGQKEASLKARIIKYHDENKSSGFFDDMLL